MVAACSSELSSVTLWWGVVHHPFSRWTGTTGRCFMGEMWEDVVWLVWRMWRRVDIVGLGVTAPWRPGLTRGMGVWGLEGRGAAECRTSAYED